MPGGVNTLPPPTPSVWLCKLKDVFFGRKSERTPSHIPTMVWWAAAIPSSSSSLMCLPPSPFSASTIRAFARAPCKVSPPVRVAAASPDNRDAPFVKDLYVPEDWVGPARAAQEAEWLKGTLRQWLDDEYCPELANEEISRRCAKVYYHCLMEKQLDVGEILMQMVMDLENFSFRESFHGAFSSANAAVDLITKKIGLLEDRQ
eukprot:c23831_g1_i1 orf=26-634(+)